jgi:hypothetical protein
MKYKLVGITGLLLMVLGLALIIMQLMAREKSIVGSIASGGTPISMGTVLVAVSRMLKRKQRDAIARSEGTKT